MSTGKHIDIICVAIVLAGVILTVLFMNGKALGIQLLDNGDSNSDSIFTKNDLDADWDRTGATFIELSGDSANIKGNGAYFSDNVLHIVYAGKYIISGSLNDGFIKVDAKSGSKIRILLNGVNIHCSDGPALQIDKAKKVFLTLAENTVNVLTSGETYSEKNIKDKKTATLYSKDSLTINGKGTLNISGNYLHAIKCSDSLMITGGILGLTSVEDAIHVKEQVGIREADINISAGDDGISVSNDSSSSKLYIESGTLTVSKCFEGLEAASITVAGGKIDIFSEDDGINATGLTKTGGVSEQNLLLSDNTVSTSAEIAFTLNGGTLTIVNRGGVDADGIDSNGSIYINGGRLFISVPNDKSTALDYGSENGGVLLINGGEVVACGGSKSFKLPSDASKQSVICCTGYNLRAGTDLSFSDNDENVISKYTVENAFSSILFSSSELKQGETYTVTAGERIVRITLSDKITYEPINIIE